MKDYKKILFKSCKGNFEMEKTDLKFEELKINIGCVKRLFKFVVVGSSHFKNNLFICTISITNYRLSGMNKPRIYDEE